MNMSKTMLAARLHEFGKPFSLDTVPIPEPKSTEVLIEVRACNVVPNLANVINHYASWFPYLPLPTLPATFGLDVAGVVADVGSQVLGLSRGERVYVNPARTCGSCKACRSADPVACQSFTFQGYFGFGPGSSRIFENYPDGGLAEYMIAPVSSLVRLPQSIGFEAGARFGYIGTAYSALRKANAGPGTSVVITGATGTLGVGAVLLALAMGVPRIFAVARNQALLERIRQWSPQRIRVLSYGTEPLEPWVRAQTDGVGADILIESLPTGAPATVTMDALKSLRRGGCGVCIGGMAETLQIDPVWFMCSELQWKGSVWFSVAEGEDLAAMADAGTLDLSQYEHRRYSLRDVNKLMASLNDRESGLTNFVVVPNSN
jgi:alcohol dehydrogenase